MAQELWLIRHGATAWSESGAHTGRTDIPLTEAGIAAAVDLARRLAGHSFELVLTSPLERARETCRLAGFGGQAIVEPALREFEYGDYEGRTTADIRRERPGWSLWSDGVPNGETLSAAGSRARQVIARATAVTGDVALFAHGHILRILAARWLGLDAEAGRFLALSTASISRLGYERETRVITGWNQL